MRTLAAYKFCLCSKGCCAPPLFPPCLHRCCRAVKNSPAEFDCRRPLVLSRQSTKFADVRALLCLAAEAMHFDLQGLRCLLGRVIIRLAW